MPFAYGMLWLLHSPKEDGLIYIFNTIRVNLTESKVQSNEKEESRSEIDFLFEMQTGMGSLKGRIEVGCTLNSSLAEKLRIFLIRIVACL